MSSWGMSIAEFKVSNRGQMALPAAVRRRHKRFTSEGSGVTIRIRYRILNARLAAGAVSAGWRRPNPVA